MRMLPDMIRVNSSNIAAIGYDSASQEVYVRFLDGSLYVYRGVPEFLYEEFKAASSYDSFRIPPVLREKTAFENRQKAQANRDKKFFPNMSPHPTSI